MKNKDRYKKKIRRQRRRRRFFQNLKVLLAQNIYIIVLIGIIFFSVIIILPRQNEKTEVEITTVAETTTEAIVEEETTTAKVDKVYKTIKPKERTEENIIEELKSRSKKNSKYKFIYSRRDEYPMDMLNAVLNNPEMLDFLVGYPDNEYTIKYLEDNQKGYNGVWDSDEIDVSGIKLTKKEKNSNYPLFLQWDERWAYIPYGDANIGMAGCGPTCLSMVIVGLTHNSKATPAQIAKYSSEHGYYVQGQGTSWSLMTDVSRQYNIKASWLSNSEQSMKAALDEGKMLICSVGKGDFTIQGHFIVIYGYTEDGFLINDPYCQVRSEKNWTYEKISSQIKTIWQYSYEE